MIGPQPPLMCGITLRGLFTTMAIVFAVLITILALLAGCAPVAPKPIIQYKTIEVPKYLRAPIPAEYTVDRTVAEPAPACGPKFCNGQVANLIDDYRSALRQSNLDKAAIRNLQPKPEDTH